MFPDIPHSKFNNDKIRNVLGWRPRYHNEALWNGVQSPPNVLGIVRSGMDHEVLMPAGWSTIEIDVVTM